MGKLKVTITHGNDSDTLMWILLGLAVLVLLASVAVPTAAGVSAGVAFLSTLIMWMTISVGVAVTGMCIFFYWRYKSNPVNKLETTTEANWTDYCREANEKAQEARNTQLGIVPVRPEPIRIASAERVVESSRDRSLPISR